MKHLISTLALVIGLLLAISPTGAFADSDADEAGSVSSAPELDPSAAGCALRWVALRC